MSIHKKDSKGMVSRYSKTKQPTQLDSNRSNKISNNSFEVRDFERIPTIYDRFERRRETADLASQQIGKFDGQNDRLNSFRNKYKEYDKQNAMKMNCQDDINATRKINNSAENEISEIKIAQNLSRTKIKNSSNENSSRNDKDINVSDLQFLFNKKLSNVEKMSLLKLKKKKEEAQKSTRLKTDNTRDSLIDEKLSSKQEEPKNSLKNSSSNIRDSIRSRDSSIQSKSKGVSHREIEASELQKNISCYSKDLEVRLAAKREKEREEQAKVANRLEREEKERKIKEIDNRFRNKRSSMPEENETQKMAQEMDFNLDMKKISMTPDISRRGSFDNTPTKKPAGPKRELDINSKLILNTLVSEIGKTEDQYLETLEQERKQLVDFISLTLSSTGKAPKTSLQFYKVIES
jgi:hypothetical protein